MSLRQRGLYVEFKRRYKEVKRDGQVVPEECNDQAIHFTSVEATTPGQNGEPPLYGSQPTFFADIDALIDFGFLKVVSTGFFEHKATLYGFSDRWQQYKSGELLEIPKHERRIQRKK